MEKEWKGWQVVAAAFGVTVLVMFLSPPILSYLEHVTYETDKHWLEEVGTVMVRALQDVCVEKPVEEVAGKEWTSITLLNNERPVIETEDERFRTFDHEVLKNLAEDQGEKVQARFQTKVAKELYYRISEDYQTVEVKVTGSNGKEMPKGRELQITKKAS